MCSTDSTVWSEGLDVEVPELGMSPQDVIDAVTAGVDETLAWAPNADVETQPESGASGVTITFAYVGGQVRVTQPAASPEVPEQSNALNPSTTADLNQPAASALDTGCGPSLQVDVEATLHTSGGALDETFPVTLVAAVDGVVAFEGVLPVSDLSGSLALSGTDFEVASLLVLGVKSDLGSTGQVLALPAEGSVGEAAAAPPEPLPDEAALDEQGGPSAARSIVGVWPADNGACEGSAVVFGTWSVDLDASIYGTPLRNAFDIGDGLDALPLHWNETSTDTELAIGVGPLPAMGCASLDFASGALTVQTRAELSFSTTDEQWAAQYSGTVSVGLSPEGRPSLEVRVVQETPGAQVTELGLSSLNSKTDPAGTDPAGTDPTGTDRTGTDPTQDAVRLETSVWSFGDTVAGYLQVNAVHSSTPTSDCQDPVTLDECVPQDYTPLLSATIGPVGER